MHRPPEAAVAENDKRPYQDGPGALAEDEDVQAGAAWFHDRFPHARGPFEALTDMWLQRAFEERIPCRAEGVEADSDPG